MSSGGITSRLWSLVFLAVAIAFAANLLMTYLVPLLPYLAVVAVLGMAGYLAFAAVNRRGW